jgi:hypothetical protein
VDQRAVVEIVDHVVVVMMIVVDVVVAVEKELMVETVKVVVLVEAATRDNLKNKLKRH